ncbi:hypothetical protein B7463_g12078, partial [Scytalidium lignicola]
MGIYTADGSAATGLLPSYSGGLHDFRALGPSSASALRRRSCSSGPVRAKLCSHHCAAAVNGQEPNRAWAAGDWREISSSVLVVAGECYEWSSLGAAPPGDRGIRIDDGGQGPRGNPIIALN